jgi:Tectonin domain
MGARFLSKLLISARGLWWQDQACKRTVAEAPPSQMRRLELASRRPYKPHVFISREKRVVAWPYVNDAATFPTTGKGLLRHLITGFGVLLSSMAMMDMLSSEASASHFNWNLNISGKANDIGEGGGKVWVIGTSPVGNGDYWVYRLTGAVNAPSPWTQMSGGGVRIAVDGNGLALVVNAQGDIYHANGDQPNDGFFHIAGKAMDIGEGGGKVWVIGTNPVGNGDYGVYRLTGAVNAPNPWTPMSGGGVRIAVDGNGLAWVVNAQGDIYHANGDQPNDGFCQVAGKAKDIGARGGNVSVIGVAPAPPYGDAVYQFIGDVDHPCNNAAWRPIGGAGTNIAVDDNGLPLVINANNDIYTGGWAPDPIGPGCPSPAPSAQPAHTCLTACASLPFPCTSNPNQCTLSFTEPVGSNCTCNTTSFGAGCYWSGKVGPP